MAFGADRTTTWVAAAAGLEVLTGAGLAIVPSVLARLLFGSDMNPTGNVVGRIAGIVMLCLALGCWPRSSEGQRPQALAPLLALSLLAAGYLAYAGLSSAMVGILLWPAAALHTLLAVLLAWTLSASREAAH